MTEKNEIPKFKPGQLVRDGYFVETWTVKEQKEDQVFVTNKRGMFRFRAEDLKLTQK